MVNVKEDLTGRVFGRLTVIEQAEDYVSPTGKHYAKWKCQCSCIEHKYVDVNASSLKQGLTMSCGCLNDECRSERIKQFQPMAADKNKKYNEYTLYDTYGVGKYFNCKDVFYFSIEDYDIIKDQCWYNKNGYARTCLKESGKYVYMHELIGCKNFDHKNRNRSDNRRENLRPATVGENVRNRSLTAANKSGVAGVYYASKEKKWCAEIGLNNQVIRLGRYSNKDDAIRVRLEAEVKYYGEFAPQQHLYEQYGIETPQNDCINQTNTD